MINQVKKKVELYSDGACKGNPGRGGYGVVMKYKIRRKELSGGYRNTTNNRMEIMGVIKGLEQLFYSCDVMVYSDSKYVVNSMEKCWAKNWKRRGWKKATGEPVANADLWELMINLCDMHSVKFQWVKGHSSNVDNNRCDELAVDATKNENLEIDQGFEDKN